MFGIKNPRIEKGYSAKRLISEWF